MQLSRPGIPKAEAELYASSLNQIARETSIDPLLAVAIIHFESRWLPNRVSDDGEDYGLGQVRARFLGACRDDADPLNDPSEACKAAKATLLDGVTNIKRMGSIIAANKAFCKEKVGSDKDPQWLAGYQGLNDLGHHRLCKPGDKTRQVLDYHAELIDKLLPKKKAPVAAAKPKPQPVAQAKPQPPRPAPPQPARPRATASRSPAKK